MLDPITRASKFLSLILRHKPETIGITLDANGWVNIDEIVAKSKGRLTQGMMAAIVQNDDKSRYTISDDGQSIRAVHGHSKEVDLGLKPMIPPPFLYHGTHDRAKATILCDGLRKMQRQYVHLSATPDVARDVGCRRGTPVIFKVRALDMHEAGLIFYVSESGMWLTDHVPPDYLEWD